MFIKIPREYFVRDMHLSRHILLFLFYFHLTCSFLACGRNWISLQPLFFFFRIRELWEDNASLLEKPMVQVLRNAEICRKTGISSDTCMLLYKCKPLQQLQAMQSCVLMCFIVVVTGNHQLPGNPGAEWYPDFWLLQGLGLFWISLYFGVSRFCQHFYGYVSLIRYSLRYVILDRYFLGVSFKMLIFWCIFYIKHSNILFYA